MSLSQADLRSALLEAGLNASLWQLANDEFEPCSYGFVAANWQAWVGSLPPELKTIEVVGGKSIAIPRWLAEVNNCVQLAMGTVWWANVGNAIKEVQSQAPRGGIAYGMMFYTAGPARPENFNVAGAHAINWFVDFLGAVRFFEPGQGSEVFPSQIEKASAAFGIAL